MTKPVGLGEGREADGGPLGARLGGGGRAHWRLCFQGGERGPGTVRSGLTHSLQLDAALLLAALPIPARGLSFIDDSHWGLKALIRQAWPGSSPVVGSIWNGLGDSQVKKVGRSLGVGAGVGGMWIRAYFAPSDHCPCFRKVEMPLYSHTPYAGLSYPRNPPPSCRASHLQA